MRQLWTSFGILFESWHHERFVATSTPCGPMPNGTIDPRLLNINTPRPFNLALRGVPDSMNGYVTTCLELVSKGPSPRGPPRGSFRESETDLVVTFLVGRPRSLILWGDTSWQNPVGKIIGPSYLLLPAVERRRCPS